MSSPIFAPKSRHRFPFSQLLQHTEKRKEDGVGEKLTK
jgi:hypothetical protein